MDLILLAMIALALDPNPAVEAAAAMDPGEREDLPDPQEQEEEALPNGEPAFAIGEPD